MRRNPSSQRRPRRAHLSSPRLASFLSDRRGSSAFEFALLLPIMMLMSFGVIQYGALFYTYTSMFNAARTASRGVSIGSLTPSSAETLARESLPKWVPAASYAFTITDAPVGGQVITQITVPTAQAAVIPYAPMPASMTARIVILKEG